MTLSKLKSQTQSSSPSFSVLICFDSRCRGGSSSNCAVLRSLASSLFPCFSFDSSARFLFWQSIYMHRQWDIEECYIFASFTQLKTYIYIYIYIYNEKRNLFSFIYIHRWDTGTKLQWRVTTYARGGGGLWGCEAPPPTRCWGGAKCHPNS